MPRSLPASASGLLLGLLTLLLLLVPAQVAQGQVVHGRLLDDTNRQPVQGAMIQLFDEGGELVAVARSNPLGNYEIAAPGAGNYRFTVTSVGYGTAGSDYFPLAERQALEANLLLPPAPVVLEEVTAEAQARPWMIEQPQALWPYFERREFYGRLGLGTFVDREFLDNWAGPLESIPEIDILLRTMERRTGLIEQQCSGPAWFLDGNRVRNINMNDLVGVADLEGIEVYRRATEIPGEFGGSDSECGVVALWTRRR
jgi:hypothetical protein